MRRSSEDNPFGLTRRECDALEALIRYGNSKAAGNSMGVEAKTIEALTASARRRMQGDSAEAMSRLQAVIWWDRYIRSLEDDPHAPIPEPPHLRRPPNSVFQMGEMAGARA